jgi:hypothetical protein
VSIENVLTRKDVCEFVAISSGSSRGFFINSS